MTSNTQNTLRVRYFGREIDMFGKQMKLISHNLQLPDLTRIYQFAGHEYVAPSIFNGLLIIFLLV